MQERHPLAFDQYRHAELHQGHYIEETIRSVLLQGYPNLEYIIVDGGSSDQTAEIIRKYEPWLSYRVSEPDRGQSDAVNQGFQKEYWPDIELAQQ